MNVHGTISKCTRKFKKNAYFRDFSRGIIFL